MSTMRDTEGDIICIEAEPDMIGIIFEDSSGLRNEPTFIRYQNVSQTRELIKKLKKALDEMEGM